MPLIAGNKYSWYFPPFLYLSHIPFPPIPPNLSLPPSQPNQPLSNHLPTANPASAATEQRTAHTPTVSSSKCASPAAHSTAAVIASTHVAAQAEWAALKRSR